jgi:HD-like signal output (HDOD) protein/ActR/RegA family two-component response regulator
MKRTIYVVDDHAQVLETAVMVLQMIERDWDVIGFTDPDQALAAVQAKAPDLVLSDQRMPSMLGSELLEKVRLLAPTAVRIIMSGQVPLDKLTLITSAHQYLAKPFSPAALNDIVKRSFAARDRLQDPGLLAVITGLRSIPSLPQVHQTLLRELEDGRTAGTAIARMVAEDPGLSLKVLHLANSPLFGSGQTVTDPMDAVICLGTDILGAIVLSQSVFRHYESLRRPEMDLPRVWMHCWETARLAQHISRDHGLRAKTAEEAFLAGLLHEIGRFILIDNFPDQFKAACDRSRQTQTALAVSLREVLQAGPSQVGAYVLELWGLPSAAVGAIAALDNPEAEGTAGFTIKTALYIADHIASGKFPPDSFPVEEWKTEYLKSMGCADKIAEWEKFFSLADGETAGD